MNKKYEFERASRPERGTRPAGDGKMSDQGWANIEAERRRKLNKAGRWLGLSIVVFCSAWLDEPSWVHQSPMLNVLGYTVSFCALILGWVVGVIVLFVTAKLALALLMPPDAILTVAEAGGAP